MGAPTPQHIVTRAIELHDRYGPDIAAQTLGVSAKSVRRWVAHRHDTDLPQPPNLTATAATRWQDHAACRGLNPGIFYSEDAAAERAAKAICAECPSRLDCLEHALTVNEQHGTWGGATERERRYIRRKRAAQRRQVAA